MGELIRADARHLPLADESVDLIVTSPPYFALRSYTDGGEHYPGQIGSEDTPQEWLANLLECTREMVRVLKPTGSIWVDLGDKYGRGTRTTVSGTNAKEGYADPGRVVPTGHDKSLLLLPERFRVACVDELGLIARAVVVWSKPNGLPESVTDRVRRSHEDWVHLVKRPRYFSAIDEIREPYAAKTFTVSTSPRRSDDGSAGDRRNKWHTDNHVSREQQLSPLGALPGSVWTISTEPLSVPTHLGVDHFAAYPTEWPRRIILGWSPSGICVECGEGRRPVVGVDWSKVPHRMSQRRSTQPTREQTVRWAGDFADWCVTEGITSRDLDQATNTFMGSHWTSHPTQQAIPTPEQWEKIRKRWPGIPGRFDVLVGEMVAAPVAARDMLDVERAGRNRATGGGVGVPVMSISGYACACPEPLAPTRPSVVLDPFGGTGTTALVASVLGRLGISVDMSADYCRLARWRVNDPGERARAMRVAKPPPVIPDQLELWPGAVETTGRSR